MVFNEWNFFSVDGLCSMKFSKCNPEEWDEEYYSNLGFVASYIL